MSSQAQVIETTIQQLQADYNHAQRQLEVAHKATQAAQSNMETWTAKVRALRREIDQYQRRLQRMQTR